MERAFLSFSSPKKKRMRRSLLMGMAAFCLLVAPSFAQESKDLKKVEEKISVGREQEVVLQKQEQKVAEGVQQLQQQLVAATKSLQDKQDEAETLSDKLRELTAAETAQGSRLKASRARLAELITALLQLSREPPEALLLHTTLTTDQIHRAILLRAMLPRIQAETKALAQDLDFLTQLHHATGEQQRLVAAARQNLIWQRSNLDQLIRARQGSLQKTAAQRAAIAKQLAALASEAQDLRQLMQKVSHSSIPKNLPGASKGVTLKQGMRLPIQGRVVRPYGQRDAYGLVSQGVTLMGVGGSPVVASFGGAYCFCWPVQGLWTDRHYGAWQRLPQLFGRFWPHRCRAWAGYSRR